MLSVPGRTPSRNPGGMRCSGGIARLCLVVAAALTITDARGAGPPVITWRRNALPLSGELVLTDIHAALDPASGLVHAMATGEGGLVLASVAPPGAPAPNWTLAADFGYPLYFYGVYVFNAREALVTGFLDGAGASYGVVMYTADGGARWSNDTRMDAGADWGGGPIEFAPDAAHGFLPR